MLYGNLKKKREERNSRTPLFGTASKELPRQQVVNDCIALYKGDVMGRVERFIPQPEKMSNQLYTAIKQHAEFSYVNFFAPVMNYYAAFLFTHPLVIKGSNSTYYSKWKEDCDQGGTDFQDLMQFAFIEALSCQTAAVAAFKKALDKPPATQLEAEAMGADDVYLRLYGDSKIQDYELDKRGNLKWIILMDVDYPRETPEDDGSTRVETFYVCDREKVVTYEIEIPNGGCSPQTVIEPLSTWFHGAKTVPVELLSFVDGQWLGKQLRNSCVANFQARTACSFNAAKSGFPMVVVATDGKLDGDAFGELGMKVGSEDTVKFLTPPSEVAANLEKRAKDTEAKIYRAASLDFMIESEKNHSWRSAQAKLLDTTVGHTTLKDYGSLVRDFAERVLVLVSRLRGEDIDWDISGFESLDKYTLGQFVEVLKQVTDTELSKLSQLGPTFTREVLTRLTEMALPDANEQTKKKMEKEVRASTKTMLAEDQEKKDLAQTLKQNAPLIPGEKEQVINNDKRTDPREPRDRLSGT